MVDVTAGGSAQDQGRAAEVGQLTARDIETALRRRYLTELNGWALLREVTITDAVVVAQHQAWAALDWRTRPMYSEMNFPPAVRRIDVLLIGPGSKSRTSPPFERIAVEIKVTRSDFRADTAVKRRAWEAVAHRFAYCTPKGLVRPDEVPEGCGLLEVDPDVFHRSLSWRREQASGVSWTVRAPRRQHFPEPFTDKFVAYLAGRASRAEHSLRATS